MRACEICCGAGTLSLTAPCRICQETGEIITYDDDGTENLEACTHCEDGLIYTEVTCEACHGTGVV